MRGIMMGQREVPFTVLVAGGIILLVTLLSVFSARGRVQGLQVEGSSANPIVQETSTPRTPASGSHGLSDDGRRSLLPFYMDCIHSPIFKSGSLHGACNVLHEPGGGNWKRAWDIFRQMDTVQVDVSRCEAFVDVIAPEKSGKAGLQPLAVHLRPHSTDHDVFLQIYCGGDFEFIRKLAEFLPIDRPVTYLDAGSNIGLASVLFSHMIMGTGQVVAVDANPETVKVMKSNVANFHDTIVPVQAAIVDSKTAREKSSLTFKGESNQYWGFRVDHDGSKAANTVTFDVPTKSLADLRDMTKAKHFDLVKLDVEGEELYLMEDPESKAVLCEATCVFMELHERFVPGCDAAFNKFMQNGCEGEQFKEVIRTGEYIVICKGSAALQSS